jgi:hypothetical protein
MVPFWLSSKNVKRAESTDKAKMPRDAILFPPTFKILLFFSVLSESYLTPGQCYLGKHIFLIALPFISNHAAIPGWWTIIAVLHST